MPGGCGVRGEAAAAGSTEDGPIDVPVLSLDAVADGLEASGELLSHDHRPMPAAAAQNMHVHTVLIRQCQKRQGAPETSFDEPLGARSGQDVLAYVGVEAVGAQHLPPDCRVLRGVAQWPCIDAECAAERCVMVAIAIAGDDGPDQGSGGLGT